MSKKNKSKPPLTSRRPVKPQYTIRIVPSLYKCPLLQYNIEIIRTVPQALMYITFIITLLISN
jgi:hypothetical protein